MKVEILVVDPGEARPHYMYVCVWPAPGSHDWQCVSMSEDRSTWICSRCRRIEQRVIRDES